MASKSPFVKCSSNIVILGLDFHPSCLGGAVSQRMDWDGLLSVSRVYHGRQILWTLLTWCLEKTGLTDMVTFRDQFAVYLFAVSC